MISLKAYYSLLKKFSTASCDDYTKQGTGNLFPSNTKANFLEKRNFIYTSSSICVTISGITGVAESSNYLHFIPKY